MVESPDGHPALLSESKDVRIAAADALRQYRTLDVARVLVTYLNETDFGVAWQDEIPGGGGVVGNEIELNLDVEAILLDDLERTGAIEYYRS